MIILRCVVCKKEFLKEVSNYNQTLKRYPNQKQWFCSPECSYTVRKGRPRQSDEVIERIRSKQLGVSVPSRGRKGHIITAETREKIRQSKLGIATKTDHSIILTELAFRKVKRFAVTHGLIPDAIFIEDGKLVALEIEKERWESAIRTKMQGYNNRNDYDKVILVWYSPSGERLKEWIKENGDWVQVA